MRLDLYMTAGAVIFSLCALLGLLAGEYGGAVVGIVMAVVFALNIAE